MRKFLQESNDWVDIACEGLTTSTVTCKLPENLPDPWDAEVLAGLPVQGEALSAKHSPHLGNLAGMAVGTGTFALLADIVLDIPIEKLIGLAPHAATFFLKCMEVAATIQVSSAAALLPEILGAGFEGVELLEAVSNTVDGLDIVEGVATLGLSLLAGAVVKAGVDSMYEADRQKNIELRQALDCKLVLLQEIIKANPDLGRVEGVAGVLEMQNRSPWAF